MVELDYQEMKNFGANALILASLLLPLHLTGLSKSSPWEPHTFLCEYPEQAGLEVAESFTIPDAELSFDGPASPEVTLAWRFRFEGMKLLQDFCGGDFAEVRDEFLAAFSLPGHSSVAKVCRVLATTPEAA